eukprot:3755841-Rhodomonas_salina.1
MPRIALPLFSDTTLFMATPSLHRRDLVSPPPPPFGLLGSPLPPFSSSAFQGVALPPSCSGRLSLLFRRRSVGHFPRTLSF